MPICTNTIFERGGRELIELLTHCVSSFNTDVLFLYLVREYQFRPQASSAIAIYDVFCAAGAPARISAASAIAPNDMRLDQTIASLRLKLQATIARSPKSEDVAEEDSEDPGGESIPVAIPLPPRFLFDTIVAQLNEAGESKITKLESYYDPKLTPQENLPGGEMSAGQRAFVEYVWTPRIRPYLVSSGFWRVATVG